jgi:hypothetical protein
MCLAPGRAKVDRVVDPVDKGIMTTKPGLSEDEGYSTKLGDLKDHLFEVLVDEKLYRDLVGEISGNRGTAIDNREYFRDRLSSELEAVLQSEIPIHELGSCTAVNHASAFYLTVKQASEDDRGFGA